MAFLPQIRCEYMGSYVTGGFLLSQRWVYDPGIIPADFIPGLSQLGGLPIDELVNGIVSLWPAVWPETTSFVSELTGFPVFPAADGYLKAFELEDSQTSGTSIILIGHEALYLYDEDAGVVAPSGAVPWEHPEIGDTVAVGGWPDIPDPASSPRWIVIADRYLRFAWRPEYWAMIAPDNKSSLDLITWIQGTGAGSVDISEWLAAEGRDAAVTFERNLTDSGVTWRSYTQSGILYVEAWVTVAPEPGDPPLGFYVPRKHPGIGGLQAACAGLYVLFGGDLFGHRVKEDV
jgi:hypothetical protein